MSLLLQGLNHNVFESSHFDPSTSPIFNLVLYIISVMTGQMAILPQRLMYASPASQFPSSDGPEVVPAATGTITPQAMSTFGSGVATSSHPSPASYDMHVQPTIHAVKSVHAMSDDSVKDLADESSSLSNRKKTKVACQPCVRAKSGCGEVRPCKRCVRLHQEDTCVNRPVKPTRSRKRQRSEEPLGSQFMMQTSMHPQMLMPQPQPYARAHSSHHIPHSIPAAHSNGPLVIQANGDRGFPVKAYPVGPSLGMFPSLTPISESLPFIPQPRPIGMPFAMKYSGESVPKVATVIGSGAWTRKGESCNAEKNIDSTQHI